MCWRHFEEFRRFWLVDDSWRRPPKAIKGRREAGMAVLTQQSLRVGHVRKPPKKPAHGFPPVGPGIFTCFMHTKHLLLWRSPVLELNLNWNEIDWSPFNSVYIDWCPTPAPGRSLYICIAILMIWIHCKYDTWKEKYSSFGYIWLSDVIYPQACSVPFRTSLTWIYRGLTVYMIVKSYEILWSHILVLVPFRTNVLPSFMKWS